MALIKCPECGGTISDKSDKCIHCGYPLKKENHKICDLESLSNMCSKTTEKHDSDLFDIKFPLTWYI